MDKKKSSKTKSSSSYEEKAAGNQSFCKDQKDSKNKMYESNNYNKPKSKRNKAHNTYKNDLDEVMVFESFSNDKEEWSNKKQNQVSNKNISKKQNYNNSDQNQRKFSDRNFNDDKCDQKIVNDINNIGLHDTDKSINDDGEGWSSVINQKKNKISNKKIGKKQSYSKIGQNQSRVFDRNSNDDKCDQKKSHVKNNNLNDIHKSMIDDGEGSIKNNNKKKNNHQNRNDNKNRQKQRKNEIGDNLKQYKAQEINNIDLHEKSLNHEDCMLEEIDEDLFKLSKDYSLAHCVAEDLRMGAGIAFDFKRIFGGVGKLVDQKLKIGDVGIVHRHDQFAFYLVTKKYSNGKPTMNTMEKALRSLFIIMKKNNLTKLGIPKIGCGLDKLDWSDIRSLIVDIFSGSGINITVCVPSKVIDSKTPQRLNVHITPYNLWEMEVKTIIVLFIELEQVCKKNWKDHVVDKVDTKYPFKEKYLYFNLIPFAYLLTFKTL